MPSFNQFLMNYVTWRRFEAMSVLFALLSMFSYIHVMEPEEPRIDLNAQLLRAVEEGGEKEVKLLLHKGAHVNARNRENRTPLLIAVENELFAMVKLLIENGADLEAKDPEGYTPLLLAVRRSDSGDRIEIIDLLIKKGANVNAVTKDGISALMLVPTCAPRELRAAKLLLEANADVHLLDKEGGTALDRAADQGELGLVALFLEYDANVNSRNTDGNTPLMTCIASQNNIENKIKIISLLIKYGAGINNYNTSHGDTPLIQAVASWDINTVQFLVNNGASVNGRNSHTGTSPLAEAVLNAQEGIVELLVKGGASTNGEDKYGNTPLMIAAVDCNYSLAELLIKNGALVNFQSNGHCAYSCALLSRESKFIGWLIDNGADAKIHRANQLFLDLAKPRDGREIDVKKQEAHNDLTIMLFLLLGGNVDEILPNSCKRFTKKVKQLLLAYGAKLETIRESIFDGSSEQGKLDRAAFEGNNSEVVRLLSEITLDDEHPLLLAAACGHADVVMTIVRRFDLFFGDLAKDILQCAAVNGRLKVIEALLTYYKELNLTPREARVLLLSIGARWNLDIRAILEQNLPIVVLFGESACDFAARPSKKRESIMNERGVSNESLRRIIELLIPYTTEQNRRIGERLIANVVPNGVGNLAPDRFAALMTVLRGTR